MAYKQFTPNSVLTAEEVNTYLMDQSVMVFDSASARAAALTAPIEGMVSYLKDVEEVAFFTGTDWISLVARDDAEYGAWIPYTPVWAATGTAPVVGNGSITGRYQLVGKTCNAVFELVIGSTTTFGTGTYSFTVPFTAANPSGVSVNFDYVGSARGHGPSWYHGAVGVQKGGNTARIYSHGASTEWSNTQPFTWVYSASPPNYLQAQVCYEIA